MQLHWGWIALGVLAVGALVWWTQDDADLLGGHPGRSPVKAQSARHEAGGPTLYRWTDASGVVNFTTDKPPAGKRYTIVHVDPNQNIVPMGAENSDSPSSTKRH